MKIYLRLFDYFRKYWLTMLGVLICVFIYTASHILLRLPSCASFLSMALRQI